MIKHLHLFHCEEIQNGQTIYMNSFPCFNLCFSYFAFTNFSTKEILGTSYLKTSYKPGLLVGLELFFFFLSHIFVGGLFFGKGWRQFFILKSLVFVKMWSQRVNSHWEYVGNEVFPYWLAQSFCVMTCDDMFYCQPHY